MGRHKYVITRAKSGISAKTLLRPDRIVLCVILFSHVGTSDHGISIIVDGQVRFSPPKSTMRPLLPAAAAAANAVAHFAASIAPEGGRKLRNSLPLPSRSGKSERRPNQEAIIEK